MKRIITLAICVLACCLSKASETGDSSKAVYQAAKAEIMAMLQGNKIASYERAIFLIENAYCGGILDYQKYKGFLDWHSRNIGFLLAANKENFKSNYQPTPLQAAMQSREARQEALDKLAKNWAIYTYMKGGIMPIIEGRNVKIIRDRRFSYSFADPMGTQDWNNTLVTHLLNTGTGNCFALASLYKILSDRLQADAALSVAPSHIFIRHADEGDVMYNVELSNGCFPGSGTLETLTYTTNDATNNGIAMRDLDTKQAIALCLVYLAKGYEQKFGESIDPFLFDCAVGALAADEKCLSAMLLQFELLQRKTMQKILSPEALKADKDFIALEQLTTQLYQLGYREMPLDMRNKLVRAWTRDTSVILIKKSYNPPAVNSNGVPNTRYASLSWGAFDEEIPNKPLEQYGNILFDTRTKKIRQFVKAHPLYNDYNFDPVVFAMNVDPLAHKFPWQSPYSAFDNNPIWKNDPTGAAAWVPEVQDGQLTIRKETADNVNTLAKFLSVDQNKANQLYSSMDKSGHIKLTDDVPGVAPINAAIKDYTDNPQNYSQTKFMAEQNYNCWESATSISQGRTPDFKREMGRFEFKDAIMSGYTDVTDDPSKYKFGQTVIRFAEDEFSIWHGFSNYTTHGAVYLGKSNDGTTYTWSKNGLYKKPEISSLKELQKEYGDVEGYRKEKGGGYYNPNPSIETN